MAVLSFPTCIHHRRRVQWRSKVLALQASPPGSPPLSSRPENKYISIFWHRKNISYLAVVDCVSEEVVEKEIVETWVLVKRSFDVAEESWKDIVRKF